MPLITIFAILKKPSSNFRFVPERYLTKSVQQKQYRMSTSNLELLFSIKKKNKLQMYSINELFSCLVTMLWLKEVSSKLCKLQIWS